MSNIGLIQQIVQFMNNWKLGDSNQFTVPVTDYDRDCIDNLLAVNYIKLVDDKLEVKLFESYLHYRYELNKLEENK